MGCISQTVGMEATEKQLRKEQAEKSLQCRDWKEAEKKDEA